MSAQVDAPAVARQGADVLSIEDLSVFRRDVYGGKQLVVGPLNLTLRSGETVGVVGESGSGKTIAARAASRLLPPDFTTEGVIKFRGREIQDLSTRAMSGLRRSGLTLILQDPFTMLNPLRRCGKQIKDGLVASSGQRLRNGDDEVVARLAEVGLEADVASRFPFELSGGMRQRVGLAAALASDPQLLIADEMTTALDVTVQSEVLKLLRSLQASRGMSLLMITHDLRVAFAMCTRVVVLYAGQVLESAPGHELETGSAHPYTRGLMLAEPSSERRTARLADIPGAVPSAESVRDECAFTARCRWADETCRSRRPHLAEVAHQHWSACVRLDDIRSELKPATDESIETEVGSVDAMTNQQPAVLEVVGVHKEFRAHSGKRHTALVDASLTVRRGECVALVGESGSGKTTLARAILGLDQPSGGDIVVNGVRLAGDGASLTKQMRQMLRRNVQIVFQDPYSSLNPSLSVGTSIKEALRACGRLQGTGAAAVSALLESVGLPTSYARRKPRVLSGGERQRICIARALAVEPEIIVCDEPVSSLDVSVQAQILNLLNDLRARTTFSLLFITHDLAVVRQIADRVYVMKSGAIVESGTVDQVLSSPGHPYTRKLIDSIPRADMFSPTRGGPTLRVAGDSMEMS